MHFVHEWEKGATPVPRAAGTSKRFQEWVKRMPLLYGSLAGAHEFYSRSKRKTASGLNGRNPGVVVIDVKSCI